MLSFSPNGKHRSLTKGSSFGHLISQEEQNVMITNVTQQLSQRSVVMSGGSAAALRDDPRSITNQHTSTSNHHEEEDLWGRSGLFALWGVGVFLHCLSQKEQHWHPPMPGGQTMIHRFLCNATDASCITLPAAKSCDKAKGGCCLRNTNIWDEKQTSRPAVRRLGIHNMRCFFSSRGVPVRM